MVSMECSRRFPSKKTSLPWRAEGSERQPLTLPLLSIPMTWKPARQPIQGHQGELKFESGQVRILIDGHRISYCAGYAVECTPQGQPILTVRVLLKSLNADPLIQIPQPGPVAL